jgi:hypothetical protein
MTREQVLQTIGSTAYVIRYCDNVMDRVIMRLVEDKSSVTIVKLTKSGLVQIIDPEGNTLSVKQKWLSNRPT